MNRLGNREIFRVAGPILLSLLFQQMIGLTDTAFLGRVGEVELGAAALGSVWFLAVYMLGFGFSVGVQILIARCNGEGHHSEIGRIFYSGIAFQLLLACIVFALSRLLSPLLLPRMIRSPEVCAATASYLEYRSYGFFFVYLAVMFRAFYVGITRTHILTFNSVVMVLANAVLNYALIFGKFGFPAMGIAGAAIASSAAELFSVLFYCIYTRCRIDLHKYRLEKIFTFDFAVLRRVLNLSVWTMLQSFVSVSVWFFFFIAVEHLGERPLAVINLVRNVSALVFIFTNAFATAARSDSSAFAAPIAVGWVTTFRALSPIATCSAKRKHWAAWQTRYPFRSKCCTSSCAPSGGKKLPIKFTALAAFGLSQSEVKFRCIRTMGGTPEARLIGSIAQSKKAMSGYSSRNAFR